jgi:hypothetical protein
MVLRIPIPEIQRTNAPSGNARAVSTPFIGNQGLQDVAQVVGQVGQQRMRQADQLGAEVDRFELEQKKARTVERVSAARLQWTQTLLERQGQATGEAAGFTPSVLKDFDGWADESKKAITDPDERRMFEGMVADIRGHVGTSALRFEVGQRRAYRKQVVTSGIDTDAKTVGADPSQVQAVVAQRLAAINSIDGFDPDERAALSQAARENIGWQAGATLARTDPDGWLKRDPTNDPVTSLLDPEKKRQLDNFARAEIEQRKAAREGNAQRAMKDAERAIEEAQKFVLEGGNPSPEYEQQLYARVEAAGLKPQAQRMIEIARRGAGFGSRPLPEQQQILQAMPVGDPKAAETRDFLRRVHGEQERAYREDPFAAAAMYGRAPAAQSFKIEAPEQVPQVVAERLRTISQVELLAGGAVSPLRPDEVPQVVAALSSVSIDKKAEILAQTGRQLTVERIAKLADQLDKNDRPTALMLKLGADRTDNGRSVSVLVGRGAQALKDRGVQADNSTVTGWRAEIAEKIRGAGLEGQAEQDAVDAAFYVRAALDAPGYEYDVKTNDKAVELVVGKIVERGGMKARLPRGMSEDDFTEKLAQSAAAAGDAFIVRGQPITRALLLRNLASAGLARDGSGRYTPFINGAAVFLPNGEPLRLKP